MRDKLCNTQTKGLETFVIKNPRHLISLTPKPALKDITYSTYYSAK